MNNNKLKTVAFTGPSEFKDKSNPEQYAKTYRKKYNEYYKSYYDQLSML